MKTRRYYSLVVALLLMLPGIALHAQFGIGGGLAAIGDNVYQAGGDLADLLQKDGDDIGYDDVSGDIGGYLTARYKHGMGAFRLVGDISYVYFQNSTIRLTQYNTQGMELTDATFDVGTSLIPIGAGLELTIPVDYIRPYIGAHATYTFVNRTYAFVQGDQIQDFENESAGEDEFGAAIGAGVELAIGKVMALELGARYNLMNIVTTSDSEEPMRYLQVGATLYFGDLLNEKEK